MAMSTENKIKHYQRSIERSCHDTNRLLHCINVLSKLPVTVHHLQITGVGRTVNALRKIDDGVGDAAKDLVNKWKYMVANADSSEEEDEACVPDAPESYESPEHDLQINESQQSVDLQEGYMTSSYKSDTNVEDDDNNDNDEKRYSTSNISNHNTLRDNISSISNKFSNHKDKCKSPSNRENKKERKKEKAGPSCSSSMEKNLQDKRKRKNSSSDSDTSEKRSKNTNNKYDLEDNNLLTKDQEIEQENEYYETNEEENCSSKETSHKIEKSKSKEKHHSKSKSQESSDKSKHSTSSKHSKSGSKLEHKDAHSSSSSKDRSKDKAKSSKDKIKKREKDDKSKHKESKKDIDSSDHKTKKHKSSKGKKSEENKTEVVEGGLDSSSGKSFGDALGMCTIPPPKKKTKENSFSKPAKQEQPSTSSNFPNKHSPTKLKLETSEDYEPLPLLSTSAKLEPLKLDKEIDLAATLPEPCLNYKPLPHITPAQRRQNEDNMLAQVIYAKNQRTKVFSGNKTGYTNVPSLMDMCIRVLIENIEALEFTGGVPYDIIKPVLERATPDQLFVLEHHNPYLVEESDALWQFHCNKDFRNKKREEMESWREMYLRCLDEREAKLKALTQNIKQSADKSQPARTTKLAYIDHIVKPPRNVLRKQAKFGTANSTTKASDIKHKLLTDKGSSYGGSSNNSSSFGTTSSISPPAEKIFVPPPPSVKIRPSSGSLKKPKAPLMAKALQAIKGRYKR